VTENRSTLEVGDQQFVWRRNPLREKVSPALSCWKIIWKIRGLVSKSCVKAGKRPVWGFFVTYCLIVSNSAVCLACVTPIVRRDQALLTILQWSDTIQQARHSVETISAPFFLIPWLSLI